LYLLRLDSSTRNLKYFLQLQLSVDKKDIMTLIFNSEDERKVWHDSFYAAFKAFPFDANPANHYAGGHMMPPRALDRNQSLSEASLFGNGGHGAVNRGGPMRVGRRDAMGAFGVRGKVC
jgi:hypothetical protein